MKIAMIGGGYVGLVSGACFADLGVDVCVVERDPAKLGLLNDGKMPIYEPGLDKLVGDNVAAGRLRFTEDLAAAVDGVEAVFIAVGTPTRRGDGHADVSYVNAAAEQVARALTGYAVIVTKSTVPVGTGRRIAAIMREARPDGEFDVASNPEFLREGSAIGDFMRPDRVVIGTESERAREVLRRLYRPLYLIEAPILFTGAGNGGADEICRQLVPGDEGDVHQRDGRPVREGRRGRARRGARHRAGRAHRAQVPPSRARLWRVVLPEGHARPGPHRAGLGGAVPAGGDDGGGQRGTQGRHGGARGGGLRRQRARQDARRAGPDLQARDGRHARGAEPGRSFTGWWRRVP